MEQSHGQGGGMHLACCSGRSSCGRFARRFAAVWVLCCVSEYDQNTKLLLLKVLCRWTFHIMRMVLLVIVMDESVQKFS